MFSSLDFFGICGRVIGNILQKHITPFGGPFFAAETDGFLVKIAGAIKLDALYDLITHEFFKFCVVRRWWLPVCDCTEH
jgi:hypothetical protein